MTTTNHQVGRLGRDELVPVYFAPELEMAVKHVVLWNFKAGLSPQKAQELYDQIRALKEKSLSSRNSPVAATSPRRLSQGFTHGFIMTFSDRKAVSAYLKHPEHIRPWRRFSL